MVGLTNPKHSLALFLVEGKPAGFTVGTGYSMLGLRDSNTSEIFLDQVFVPSSHLIGKEGEGFQLACKAIQRSRTMLSASAVGICDRSHDITREYLLKRELYGKTLLTHHTIMNLLSQLHAEKEAAWHLVQSAAHQWDEGINSFIPSSMAKLLTGQVAMKTASACLELFGGWGCTKEYEIERIFRDAKFCEIVEGPNLVQLAILAKELFPENKSEQKKAA